MQTADVSTTAPVNPATVQSIVNQPYQYGGGQVVAPAGQNQIALPNQINAENYANAYQYQKDLMWAGYEDQGWDIGLAQEARERALPRAVGPTKGAYSF
jgi:hypothetical protein